MLEQHLSELTSHIQQQAERSTVLGPKPDQAAMIAHQTWVLYKNPVAVPAPPRRGRKLDGTEKKNVCYFIGLDRIMSPTHAGIPKMLF